MWYDYAADGNNKCPICGAKLPKGREDWGYRIDGKDYCSYTCQRAADREWKASKIYQGIQTELTTGKPLPSAPVFRTRRVIEAPAEEIEEWKKLINAGASIASVAIKYNRTYDFVRYHLSKSGLISKSCNRLTYRQADDIRTRVKNGARIIELAVEYKVSKDTIQRILRGATYNEHK